MKTMVVLLASILLLTTVAGAIVADPSSNLVYYESNTEVSCTEVVRPLEGLNCVYDVEVSAQCQYNGEITIINHANRPVEGKLKVTLTGGWHEHWCWNSWWCTQCIDLWRLHTQVTYRDETIRFHRILGNTLPVVTHTFDSQIYQPGENIYPITVNCPTQMVNICWEVISCEE